MAGKNKLKSASKNADVSEKQVAKGENKSIRFRYRIIRFLKSERTHKIFGLLLMLLSVYIFIAFISFIFTWKQDQSVIAGSWWNLFTDSSIKVENWLGKLGAILSHTFIHKWFGVSSFFFVLLFFITGFRILFKSNILPLKKTFAYSAFGLFFLSFCMGFIFNTEQTRFLGGTIGYLSKNWMTAAIGNIGTGFFVFFGLISLIVVAFNPSLDWILLVPSKLKAAFKKSVADEEEQNETDEIVVEKKSRQNKMFATIIPETAANADSEDDVSEDELIFTTKTIIPTEIISKEELEQEIEINPLSNAIISNPENIKIETGDDNFQIEVAKPQQKELTDEELQDKIQDKIKEFGEYDPTLDLSSYEFPKIDMLQNYGDGSFQVSKEELEENKNKIVTTLANYKIGIEKIKATIGPTVTLYEIVPEPGVRISKIKNLEDDIALSLAALGIRIIAPIPGKGTIGIEVPNSKADVVSMRSLIASEKFVNSTYDLPIALGKTISNEIYIADLAKMPHLLMAGATGQGKSVGLNAILISLLYKKHPSQIKFVLVDPKKVELTIYNKIERHFLAKLPGEEEAIITDTSKVVATLNSLCIEMDNRYELLKEAQVRNLKEYNAKFVQRKLNPEHGHKFLPFIILVVDEFADLIMTAGKEVETPIARLAQLARAIGIHLIIATQRPSVNIITGTIKANFPARIAFRVTSKIDSRTILDSGGADQLIGKGDMLLSTGNELIRLQCGFVDTPEVAEITEFIGSQRGYADAHILPEYVDDNASELGSINISDRDSMFADAAKIIVLHQQGSASLLQRKLKLGYNRAGRIIDQLEAAKIIGPFEGSKARQVLISDEISLNHLLSNESEKVNY
jgi:DNA segregation ATPase FtsK/SpoIIIE, S-DNA-T family